MKVIGFYYLDYPDGIVDNPSNAATSMYVEIQEEDFNGGPSTFALNVFTYEFILENYISKNKAFLQDDILLVPTIAADWMAAYLDDNVVLIARIGDMR